jgi:rSAM/selenodomain-associated transferase 1
MEKAADIYKKMAESIIEKCSDEKYDTLCFIEPYDVPLFKSWLGDRKFYPQSDSDLGMRMYNAFESAFDMGYNQVVLTGSDIPGLSGDNIKSALKSLEDYDTVIGPAEDGGYYLIGFNVETLIKDVFIDISWSTEKVLSQTINVFDKIKYNTKIIDKLPDLDNIDDMKREGFDL